MRLSSLKLGKDGSCCVSLNPDLTHPVYVFDVGYHKTPSGYSFGPAVREYFLLHLIEKGKGFIERNGTVTPLAEGDAFLIVPNECTTYRADKEDPWEYYWIAFSGDFAKTLVEKTTDKLCMPCQKSGLMALKNGFLQATQNKNTDTVSILAVLMQVLEAIKSEEVAKKSEEVTDVISLSLKYLENNYYRDIDVASLAEELGFSRAYFSTLFLKRTGETPYKYLTKIRLERAKSYVLNSRFSMEEIAYSTGFSSLQRFSEMFKKLYGLSPLQYKKSLTDT